MRALITGDRGFLGRHFAAELRRWKWDVVGLDTTTTATQDCRTYFRTYFRECVRRGMELGTWDLVVHCAAVVGGRETIENDPLATAESLSIDAEMFRWAAVARPGRVLYISSSAAYPVAYQTWDRAYALHEDDVWDRLAPGQLPDVGMPDEIYGWSKVTGELLADRLRRAGVPVTVVRPFSGYGTDQDPSYPFRAILERVRAQEDPITVWSASVRDFIHVDDVVRGALAVAESGTELPVNLCTGRATSFTELAVMMADAAGFTDCRVDVMTGRPAGVEYRVGDTGRMLQYYTPEVTLEEGIRRALDGV